MSGAPRILAGFVQGSLEVLDGIDASLGRRLRDELKPGTLDAIESASTIGWVDVEHDVELTETLFRLAGSERAWEAMRANFRDSLDKPLLKPLLEGALAIFGRSPERILRWGPRVWSFLFRDAGEMTLADSGPGHARLELHGLPPVFSASRPYFEGTGASVLGFFDVVRIEAEVRIEGPDPAGGTAAIEVTWRT